MSATGLIFSQSALLFPFCVTAFLAAESPEPVSTRPFSLGVGHMLIFLPLCCPDSAVKVSLLPVKA